MNHITLNDFQLANHWQQDETGPRWQDRTPQYLIDTTTKRAYLNESKGVVRFKCALLSLGTPIVHTIAAIVTIAHRVLRIITLYHLWVSKMGECEYSLKTRVQAMGLDLAKIFTAPLSVIALELAALYGTVYSAYDGRKLYASIERFQYGSFVLAPCFQPDPTRHAFGGDINLKDAF